MLICAFYMRHAHRTHRRVCLLPLRTVSISQRNKENNESNDNHKYHYSFYPLSLWHAHCTVSNKGLLWVSGSVVAIFQLYHTHLELHNVLLLFNSSGIKQVIKIASCFGHWFFTFCVFFLSHIWICFVCNMNATHQHTRTRTHIHRHQLKQRKSEFASHSHRYQWLIDF